VRPEAKLLLGIQTIALVNKHVSNAAFAERCFSITSTAHVAVALHALESTERLSLDDESIFA